jgi:hypothetical protein
MTMWRSGRPTVKSNEVYRVLPALVSLGGIPLVAFICTGLIMAGHVLSPPGMNEFYAGVNGTVGVVFLWNCTLLLLRRSCITDERPNKARENPQFSGWRFRIMAQEVFPLTPRHHMYASNLLRKQGTL